MKHVFTIRRHPAGRRFLAINLFGFILTRRPLSSSELRHEYIHSHQQREMLYLPFFLWYVVEWLLLCLRYRDSMQAYRHISFEREAYEHQDEEDYLSHRKWMAWARGK